MKRFHLAKILLVASLIFITLFQVYWLFRYYKDAQDTLYDEIGVELEETSHRVLKLDLLEPYEEGKGGDIAIDRLHPSIQKELYESGYTFPDSLVTQEGYDYLMGNYFDLSLENPVYKDFDTTLMSRLQTIGILSEDLYYERYYRGDMEFVMPDDRVEFFYTDFFGNTIGLGLLNTEKLIFNKLAFFLFSTLILLMLLAFSGYYVFKEFSKQKQLTALKDDFINNISHELRTPITSVGIALEALEKHKEMTHEAISDYVDISIKENERLKHLVERIMEATAMKTNYAVFQKEVFDLKIVALTLINAYRLEVEKLDGHIKLELPEGELLIEADIDHVTNVLSNIINNAIKYSNKNPEIQFVASIKGPFIHIKIEDKGMGIPKEFQDKVFDQFFRVPKGNRHDVKGLGLGLHYCKQIMQELGGSIQMVSQEGKGSTFNIKLPLYGI